jgi:prepilin-type N-terminal cleavage/methylation domain-containing protein
MEMTKMTKLKCRMTTEQGFTLIELLVVIAIIAALLGLAFPVFQGVLDRAKKVQAKNDLTQIVTAVNAYYTEYGKYPVDVPTGNTTDAFFGTGTTPTGDSGYGNNDTLMDVLRNNTSSTKTSANVCSGQNLVTCLNGRGIVFISPPNASNANQPRAGIASLSVTVNGISIPIGTFVDPWGMPYNVEIDASYNNTVPNPYGALTVGGAGADPVSQGVTAWSLGKDKKLGNNGNNIYKTSAGVQSDDVISWQ